MFVFKRQSLIERIMMLWPPYRKKKDQEFEKIIRFLGENPKEPCFIEGRYFPGRSKE